MQAQIDVIRLLGQPAGWEICIQSYTYYRFVYCYLVCGTNTLGKEDGGGPPRLVLGTNTTQ